MPEITKDYIAGVMGLARFWEGERLAEAAERMVRYHLDESENHRGGQQYDLAMMKVGHWRIVANWARCASGITPDKVPPITHADVVTLAEKMERLREQCTPEMARATLINSGYLDASGSIAEPYRDSIPMLTGSDQVPVKETQPERSSRSN